MILHNYPCNISNLTPHCINWKIKVKPAGPSTMTSFSALAGGYLLCESVPTGPLTTDISQFQCSSCWCRPASAPPGLACSAMWGTAPAGRTAGGRLSSRTVPRTNTTLPVSPTSTRSVSLLSRVGNMVHSMVVW